MFYGYLYIALLVIDIYIIQYIFQYISYSIRITELYVCYSNNNCFCNFYLQFIYYKFCSKIQIWKAIIGINDNLVGFVFFSLLSEYQIFAGEEVPQVDDGRGYYLGEHVVGADAVGKEPDEGVVEQQPHHADGGKEEELDQPVLELRVAEYPDATDNVVDEQPRDEREGGREQVVQPGILGEDIE